MCGIFGILTPEPKQLDKRAFTVLGVNNDSRGGDACGVFIDGKVEYGLEKDNKELFVNFFPTSEVIKEAKKTTIALGHCRKASVGGKAPELAQPVVIRDENGEIKFVLLHNGTLKNHDDLAKKYLPDMDVKGMSDSQVIANIIYKHGYDVFGEYAGAGVFVACDYSGEKPVVRFFKGASKEYYNSAKPSEERPLFYVLKKNGELIFSSIAAFLFPLYPNDTVYYFPENQLVRYEDGQLVKEKEYDRTSLCQLSSYTSTGAYYGGAPFHGLPAAGSQGRGKGSENTIDVRGNYLFDDDDDDDYGYGCYTGYRPAPTSNNDTIKIQLNTTSMKFFKKIISSNTVSTLLAHGKYNIGSSGVIVDFDRDDNAWYFWNGVLLYNKGCYNFLNRLIADMNVTKSELSAAFPFLPWFFSPYPIKDKEITDSFWCLKVKDPYGLDTEKMNGTLPKLFDSTILKWDDGYLRFDEPKSSYADNVSNMREIMKTFKIPKEVAKELLSV